MKNLLGHSKEQRSKALNIIKNSLLALFVVGLLTSGGLFLYARGKKSVQPTPQPEVKSTSDIPATSEPTQPLSQEPPASIPKPKTIAPSPTPVAPSPVAPDEKPAKLQTAQALQNALNTVAQAEALNGTATSSNYQSNIANRRGLIALARTQMGTRPKWEQAQRAYDALKDCLDAADNGLRSEEQSFIYNNASYLNDAIEFYTQMSVKEALAEFELGVFTKGF